MKTQHSPGPWNEPEPPCMNYYDEADYHEEHRNDE